MNDRQKCTFLARNVVVSEVADINGGQIVTGEFSITEPKLTLAITNRSLPALRETK